MGAKRLRVLVIGAGVGGLSAARGLLRDGHDVTVFERRACVEPGGGAVTIWSNGATVLRQLGVDMAGAGQELSTVRVVTSTGRRVTTLDLTAVVERLGAPVSMVPRRVLLERVLNGFPTNRIRYDARAVAVVAGDDRVRVEFADGSAADGDVLIGADGMHSMVRDVVGAQHARLTGWCSWQGLAPLGGCGDDRVALMIVGPHGNLGVWPAGGSDVQWWFDLPWSSDFVRPDRPLEMIRSQFSGWSDAVVDRVLARLTEEDLAPSPYPHYRHPIPRVLEHGALTLLGDAAHTMPPTLAQGTNQALLDTLVLCRALSGGFGDVCTALRWYEKTRRRRVSAVSRVASLQVSHGESMLAPAALVPDGVMTWALTRFLSAVSHRRISAEVDRHLAAAGAS